MMKIQDEEERSDAVLTANHAFVWASAGTGKTHTLTLRALYLLLTAPFDARAADTPCGALYQAVARAERLRAAHAVIRRFVLTTFTRKAAAEMQTRLYSYLDAVAGAESLQSLRERFPRDAQFVEVVEAVLAKMPGGSDGFARLRRGAEALGELATELQVCTLHSFAVTILRRHLVAAGIPPNAQFADEDDATVLDVAGRVVDRWWQKVLAEEKLLRALEALVETVPLEDMRKWLESVYHHPWIARQIDFGPPDGEAIANILGASERLATALQGAPPNASRVIRAGEKLAGIVTKIKIGQPLAWTEFCVFIRDSHEVLFGSKTSQAAQKAIASLGESAAYFMDHDSTYATVVQKCLVEDHAENWSRWRAFISQFADWCESAAVRELALVTFDDMVRLAARLLRENRDVRAQERARLWAILVDEFQDTDPVQLELLEWLLKRGSPGDHEVLGFFVGDKKQSIYRFRGADLPAIQHFVNRYPEIVTTSSISVFQLRASFRSLRPITDFVNHFFERCVPFPDYAEERLAPVREDEGQVPEWRLLNLERKGLRVAKLLELAAQETANLIKEYHEHANRGDAAYSDIVVLVRTHEELDVLLPVLERAGIPVVSSGAKTFYQQPEVLDVLNLLIAAHNPRDALAVGSLLRSPLVGLSDAQIYRLLETLPPHAVFHSREKLSADLPPEATRRIEQTRGLIGVRSLNALAPWLRQVRSFIPAGIYAQQNPEGRGVARIDQVIEAFRRAVELGSTAPLAWLLDQRARARETFDADFGEDVSITDESMAAVRAMTVHKAKGLQGKYVMVFGWQKALDKMQPEKPRENIFNLTSEAGQRVCGFQLPWGRLVVVSPDYPRAKQLDQHYESEEARRLAYVAATRAKDHLLLLSPHTGELTNGLLAEAKSSPAEAQPATRVFDGTLNVNVVKLRAVTPGTPGKGITIRNKADYRRLWRGRAEASAQDPAPLLSKPSSAEEPQEEDAVEPTDYVRAKMEAAREQARQTGTLVHRYLERHLIDDEFAAAKLDQLVSEDEDARPGAAAVEAAGRILQQFFGGAYHQRARRSRIEAREAPVFLTEKGHAWSGVIDLVLSEDGAVVGVDYKVARKPGRLSAKHAQQQRVYAEALRRAFPGRRVSFEFWWLGQ